MCRVYCITHRQIVLEVNGGKPAWQKVKSIRLKLFTIQETAHPISAIIGVDTDDVEVLGCPNSDLTDDNRVAHQFAQAYVETQTSKEYLNYARAKMLRKVIDRVNAACDKVEKLLTD